jgi:hypothetical protein
VAPLYHLIMPPYVALLIFDDAPLRGLLFSSLRRYTARFSVFLTLLSLEHGSALICLFEPSLPMFMADL